MITPEQKAKFDKQHIPYEPFDENKSLMDMSKDELDESWEKYQRLVEIDNNDKEMEK